MNGNDFGIDIRKEEPRIFSSQERERVRSVLETCLSGELGRTWCEVLELREMLVDRREAYNVAAHALGACDDESAWVWEHVLTTLGEQISRLVQQISDWEHLWENGNRTKEAFMSTSLLPGELGWKRVYGTQGTYEKDGGDYCPSQMREQREYERKYRKYVEQLVLGARKCRESPAGVCVYNQALDPEHQACVVCGEAEGACKPTYYKCLNCGNDVDDCVCDKYAD